MKTKLIVIISSIFVAIGIAVIVCVNLSSEPSVPLEENEGPSHTEVEIPIGKYYLGGDKNSD
ncbi:MAG: hypothetical protein J6A16_07105, partial [Oscillospiraceae bacterium]|nr:hypothetical protein [Oscillospiraceae bacterium]